jgi:hypothetical protein
VAEGLKLSYKIHPNPTAILVNAVAPKIQERMQRKGNIPNGKYLPTWAREQRFLPGCNKISILNLGEFSARYPHALLDNVK